MRYSRFIFYSAILQLALLLFSAPWSLKVDGFPFRWIDLVVLAPCYVYLILLVSIGHSVVSARLGRSFLIAAETLTTYYLIATTVVNYRFGVQLDHPIVTGIFLRSDHNWGLALRPADMALLLVSFLFTLGAHLGLARLAARDRPGPPSPRSRSGAASLLRIAVCVLGVVVYVAGIYFYLPDDDDYAFPQRALPGYATINRFLENKPEVRSFYRFGAEPTRLKLRPNIILLMADTFRWDLLSESVTPNLYALSKRANCVSSRRHYSGSTSTAFGSFAYLTGLNGYHYPATREAQIGSAALKVLRDNQYEIHGRDASGLMAYHPPVLAEDDFNDYLFLGSLPTLAADAKVADEIIALKERRTNGRPQFIFGFFYSTHAPYNAPDSVSAPEANLSSARVPSEDFIRYRRSAFYVDQLVGKVVAKYDEELRRGDLTFAFVGDHGEEFGEFGAEGHGGNGVEDVRTRVPLVLCLPGAKDLKVNLSTNADVLPTILGWAGASPERLAENFEGLPLTLRSKSMAVVSVAGFPKGSSRIVGITESGKFTFDLPRPELSSLSLLRFANREDVSFTPSSDLYAEAASVAEQLRRDYRRWLKLVNSVDPADHAADSEGRARTTPVTRK